MENTVIFQHNVLLYQYLELLIVFYEPIMNLTPKSPKTFLISEYVRSQEFYLFNLEEISTLEMSDLFQFLFSFHHHSEEALCLHHVLDLLFPTFHVFLFILIYSFVLVAHNLQQLVQVEYKERSLRPLIWMHEFVLVFE